MKKLTYLIAASLILSSAAKANLVSPSDAKAVAQNFYSQTYQTAGATATLTYTEKDASGQEVYYVFNINNSGFVVVSAEDAGRPIIGYSNTGQYTIPTKGSNLDYWMGKRKKEITYIRTKKLTGTKDISDEWTAYLNNTTLAKKNSFRKVMGTYPSSTAHLVQSTWDQSPYYNADCPGGSVTGCVATAMSQIMRFWNYPPRGRDSNSYCDCTADSFQMNYGTLSANFGNTAYNWANMPLSVTKANGDVAALLYDAGVSVDMDYDPSGSGAYVISADNPVCAQNSYVTYFSYNPTTIYGFYDSTISSTSLIDTLQNEINNGRPVEYAGYDATAGGHTWVCDGYNSLNDFHMNWGWSGQDDGWFALNNLNPGGTSGYNFAIDNECLIGIEPRNIFANFSANNTLICPGNTVTFTDQSITNGTITGYSWTFPGGTPSTSTAKSPSVTYNTSGLYTVTEIVISSNGTDSAKITNYITVTASSAAPIAEGFESGVYPPAGWVIHNPQNHSATWSLFTDSGGYSKSVNCMFFNNCIDGTVGNRDQIYSPLVNYTGNANPYIYFDVAYEPYGVYQKFNYSDTLAVYYSTDCGTTWNNIYLKGGKQLSTTGDSAVAGYDTTVATGGCFAPNYQTWRTDTIFIPALANQSGIMFSFENRSGYGSNLYVDNINTQSSALGVINLSDPQLAIVYPNPNNGSFTVELGSLKNQQQLEVFNVLGQNIYSAELNQTKTQINLTQPAGVYFYRILSIDGKTLSEGKLVIK